MQRLEVSGAVRLIYKSLGVRGLNRTGCNISRLKHYRREVVHTSVSGSSGLKSQSVLLVVLSLTDML